MQVSYSLLQGDFPASNVFGLDDPAGYKCFVIQYSTAFSHMIVDGICENKSGSSNFRITFHSVAFFCGQMHWKTANFYVASGDECFELVRSFKQYRDITRDVALRSFTLFTVEDTEPPVRILAHHAVKINVSDLSDEEKLKLLR